MPMHYAKVQELNRKVSLDQIEALRKEVDAFAPGKPFPFELLIPDEDPVANRALRMFFSRVPVSIQEAINAVVRSALTRDKHPALVFNWAPSYSYEVNVWEADCGISITLKTPFANDRETGGIHA